MQENADWLRRADATFAQAKPEHFTRFWHCDECAEHDQTLLQFEADTIGLEQLGNPAWDPICFSSVEGKLYYMPAMIRLTLETMDAEFYLDQWLFHLTLDGPDNELCRAATAEQRALICELLAFILEHYPDQLEQGFALDDLLRCYEIWSAEATPQIMPQAPR
ncbi:hypothetical protein [Neptuniibacter halophilus]|uniref:hypothetical protein n=1 Tax=Neptuniibacter halophilus TaxID=651666 RepID=UPI002572E3A5|nr:hypothetical protein [Neptuniibacter halophilus]